MKIYKNNTILKDCLRVFAFRNKYDIKANDIVRQIFDRVKNNAFGETSIDNVWIEIAKSDSLKKTFDNFHISAKTENDKIYVNIFLTSDFSKSDYQKFNYILYEVIRHELEHVDKYETGIRPDEKYVELYNNLMYFNDLVEHAQMVSDYVLSDTEIDSYVKSIMYTAKKQNKSAYEIIDMVIKRAFFNNDSEKMKVGMKNKEIASIIEKTRKELRDKIREYYPNFKEKWL